MSPVEPSPIVVAQRIRNRIIEYLELAASIEAQRAYQAHQACHVPSEVINQWEDNVYGDLSYYAPPVFSPEEHAAISAYQSVWLSTCDDTPDPLPELEALIGTEPWEQLRRAAETALKVFARRGKLDEDLVDVLNGTQLSRQSARS